MRTPDQLQQRDIIVIGASAGGVEALISLVAGLPEQLPAAVFVVLHLAPQSVSVLPSILSRSGKLPAVHPADGDRIQPGRIYVAPPDRHLLIEDARVRVRMGPKENRHRPSVDPMFRTAARAYGPRVIAVVLTGSGDDGTAGLLEVKRHGGTAVVQHPDDAFSPGMPRSAAQEVAVDHCVPLREIAPLLAQLAHEHAGATAAEDLTMPNQDADAIRAPRDEQPTTLEQETMPGPHFGFTCPQCKGHLWEVKDDHFLRFRCRVGHAFSADSLITGMGESLESALWAALNAFQENAALAERMAARAHERGHHHTARRLEDRARDIETHARVLRDLLHTSHFSPPDSDLEPSDSPSDAYKPMQAS